MASEPNAPAPNRKGRWAVVGLLALLLGAGAAGCDRLRDAPAPVAANPAARPFPELAAIARVIAETRAILPRLPGGVAPPALAPDQEAAAPAPVRLALVGEAQLLRPGDFPALPRRLRMEVHLDARDPPGGHLRVTDAGGEARWPVLDSYGRGDPAGAFALTLRVVDGAARLRYLTVLGVPYEAEGGRFRAFEGYLLLPGPDGNPGPAGAMYPVDFGYRHPEPPEPVRLAAALAATLAALRTRHAQWIARGAQLARLEATARTLRDTDVPAAQVAQKQRDLADFAARAEAARAELAQGAAVLRTRLAAAYGERVALARSWAAFVGSNAYRWRDAAGRRAAYAPLLALRAAYPVLEQVYGAVDGAAHEALRAARAAMEQAVLQEPAPAP